VLHKVARQLGINHRFSVANSAWTNGTVERMMREILRTAKSILNERRRPLSEWIVVVPAIQWALNTAWRKRLGASPFQAMMGRHPRTTLDVLVEENAEGVSLSPVDPQELRNRVQQVTAAQEALHVQIVERVKQARQQSRERASRGQLPHFTVGDYVLVARVRQPGKNSKLESTWTGPWQVTNDDKEHVYTVRNIVTGETRDVHVTRMRFYADSALEVTQPLQEVFQSIEQQGEYHIRSIDDVRKARQGDEYVVLVQWEGLDDAEGTWEPVSRIMEDAPTVLRRALKRIKPSATIKRELQRRYKLKV